MGRDGSGVKRASASSIEITFVFEGKRCRERLAIAPTLSGLKKAALFRAAVLHSIENGDFDYAVTFPNSKNIQKFGKVAVDGDTVAQFLVKFLESQEDKLKSSTYFDYSNTIKNIYAKSVIAQISVKDLTKGDMRRFCESIAAGNKRVANVLSVLRSALAQAVEDEYLEVNLLKGWRYRKKEKVKENDDVDVFTVEEQGRVIEHMLHEDRPWFIFAFWTGLRTSEMIGLEWRDADFGSGEIRVVRAQTYRSKKAETPKSAASRRAVKILSPAMAALVAQKEHSFADGGRIWKIKNARVAYYKWVTACAKSGVRYRKPYQTRHTYASRMLTAGENPMWVAEQMGHEDWGLIRKVYGKFIPGSYPDAGLAAVVMFGPHTEERQQQ